MFEKNDKLLSIARVINNVVAWIGIIGGVLTGIILCCIEYGDYLSLGLSLLFCVPVFSALGWMVLRLILNYFCDIKLIRNKLYGVGNGDLYAFLVRNSVEDSNDTFSSASSKLMQLKTLLDQGIITQAEFDREKEKLLK